MWYARIGSLLALVAIVFALTGCNQPVVYTSPNRGTGGYGSPSQRSWAGGDIDRGVFHGPDSIVRGDSTGNFRLNEPATKLDAMLFALRANDGTRRESRLDITEAIFWLCVFLALAALLIGLIVWLVSRSRNNASRQETSVVRSEAVPITQNFHAHGNGQWDQGNRGYGGGTQYLPPAAQPQLGPGYPPHSGHPVAQHPYPIQYGQPPYYSEQGPRPIGFRGDDPYQQRPQRELGGGSRIVPVSGGSDDRRLRNIQRQIEGLESRYSKHALQDPRIDEIMERLKRYDSEIDRLSSLANNHGEQLERHSGRLTTIETEVAQIAIALQRATELIRSNTGQIQAMASVAEESAATMRAMQARLTGGQ